jgi:G3E family GTPase
MKATFGSMSWFYLVSASCISKSSSFLMPVSSPTLRRLKSLTTTSSVRLQMAARAGSSKISSSVNHQKKEEHTIEDNHEESVQSIHHHGKVPVTFITGFLGTGKTSTLQHLLQNTEGLQIGVIVNDMASVNIDAKLVSAASQSQSGVIELHNGCACCSLADELMTSIDSLLTSRSQKVNNAIEDEKKEEEEEELNDGARISKNKIRPFDAVVIELSGVADPMSIQQNWNFAKLQKHSVTEKAEISRVVTLIDASTFGTDFMAWETAGQRDGWVDPADECAANRKVPELLVEQIEAADVILVNKVDLAGPEQVTIASALARSINQKAILEEVQFGRVALKQILRHPKPIDIPDNLLVDNQSSDSHDHSHSSHSDKDVGCDKPGCTEDHSHEHHAHDHASHDPTVSAGSDLEGSTPSSSHSHEHSHSHSASTNSHGIVSFVYKRDRPFNPKKLMPLLNTWPVPIKDDLDFDSIREALDTRYDSADTIKGPESSPFFGVLRSKGFCWIAPSRWNDAMGDPWRHDTVMYWSHAGKHFGIGAAGKWWGTLTKQQLKDYFAGDPKEYERILSEDFVSEEFGDRRQEIVFIGVGIDEELITNALDDCLLKDQGIERYRQELNNYINIRATKESPGLINIGGVDHLDL